MRYIVRRTQWIPAIYLCAKTVYLLWMEASADGLSHQKWFIEFRPFSPVVFAGCAGPCVSTAIINKLAKWIGEISTGNFVQVLSSSSALCCARKRKINVMTVGTVGALLNICNHHYLWFRDTVRARERESSTKIKHFFFFIQFQSLACFSLLILLHSVLCFMAISFYLRSTSRLFLLAGCSHSLFSVERDEREKQKSQKQ